jgi:hypothetical protein
VTGCSLCEQVSIQSSAATSGCTAGHRSDDKARPLSHPAHTSRQCRPDPEHATRDYGHSILSLLVKGTCTIKLLFVMPSVTRSVSQHRSYITSEP